MFAARLAPVLTEAVLQPLGSFRREGFQLRPGAQRAQRGGDVVAGLAHEAVGVQQRPEQQPPQLGGHMRLEGRAAALHDMLQRLLQRIEKTVDTASLKT